jgi:hypothetical protein
MGQQCDLNEIRRTLQESRQRGDLEPLQSSRQLVVHDGRIQTADDLDPGEERQAAQIHQATFASASNRRQREQQLVDNKMPSNTRFVMVSGVGGWLYHVVNEYNETFEFFTYFDGDLYQTKVVSPEVEGQYSPHNGHLFNDGRICYGDSKSQRNLEMAYSKAVLWANGFTPFQLTGEFPF